MIERETELYPPLNRFLTDRGYTVQAEVNHCDVVALKGEDVIIIEIKRRFDLTLLIQAAERQAISQSVYVALPASAKDKRGRLWSKKTRLLRRLELGLILIHSDHPEPQVEIVFHPLPYQRRKQPRQRRAVLKEISNRHGAYNLGGSTRQNLVTAYRENAILVACCLDKYGPLTPRQLRTLETGPKTLSILSNNHYQWFERVARGVYDLSASGRAALETYDDVARKYRKRLDTSLVSPFPEDNQAKVKKRH